DGPVEYVAPDGPVEYVAPDGPVEYVAPDGAPGYSGPEPGGTYTYREDPADYFSGSADDQPAADEPPAVAGADEPDPAHVSAPEMPAPTAAEPGPAPDIEPELLPAYDAGRDQQPYVAPHDPHNGAQTEPFRGPFEPHPAQPKLGDLADPAPPVELTPYSELSRTRTVPGADADTVGGPPAGRREPANEGSEEKLEKIKDLYLTVEAIGDENVDKHFDELLKRQRELISDYFKETGIGTGKAPAAQPDQPHNN
ncbi:MAG: hypothetical protein ACLPKE_29285, partial [Streptosporangiaceae bacterium]